MQNLGRPLPLRPRARLWPALALSLVAHGAALAVAPWARPGPAPARPQRLEAKLLAPHPAPSPLPTLPAPASPAPPHPLSGQATAASAQASATPATPTPEGSLDALPYPLEPITPIYPQHLGAQAISGTVLVELAIAETGAVTAVEVVQAEPPGIFDTAAILAFREARFAPGRVGGRAVAAHITASLLFTPHTEAP